MYLHSFSLWGNVSIQALELVPFHCPNPSSAVYLVVWDVSQEGFSNLSHTFAMTFQFILIFFLALLAVPSHCAFTLPTTVPYAKDAVQQNTAGTWCFYPATKNVHNLACSGVRSDQRTEFTSVLNAHLNQTISIGYYALDDSRLGGAEWVLTTTAGPVRICLSGRAGDGTYETRCGNVDADNSLGNDSGRICRLAVGQTAVKDGCYEPGQKPYASPAITPGSSSSPTARAGSPSTSTGYSVFNPGHKSLITHNHFSQNSSAVIRNIFCFRIYCQLH